MKSGSPEASREYLLVAVLTVLLALTFAILASPDFRFSGDSHRYVSLARRIAHVDLPIRDQGPEVQFPPGFPLLLAPMAWFSRGSFEWIARWAALLAGLVFPLTWLYVRRRDPRLALPVALLTVCSVAGLSAATGNPMSEPSFLVVSLALLLWGDRMADTRSRPGWMDALLGCALMVALPAIRTAGVAAIPALLLTMASDRSRRRLVEILPAIAGVIFLFGWFRWTASHVPPPAYQGDPTPGYLGQLLSADPHHRDLGRASLFQLISRLPGNLRNSAAHTGELFFPIPWIQPAWYSPVMLLLPLLLIGWVRHLRSATTRFSALYFLCYGGIILVWPYDEGYRFLLPVLPLLWLYGIEGIRLLPDLIRRHPRLIRRAGLLMCAAALGAWIISTRLGTAALSRQDLASLAFWLAAAVALLALRRFPPRAMSLLDGGMPGAALRFGVAILVLGSWVQVAPQLRDNLLRIPPRTGNSRSLWEASSWLSDHVPPSTVLQAASGSRLRFATGLPTAPFPATARPEPFLEVDTRYHPQVLLVLESDDPYSLPIERDRLQILNRLFPDRWRRVHQFYEGSIYARQ